MNTKTTEEYGIFFLGMYDSRRRKYPAWRYHKILEPIVVKNTEEDNACQKKGYETIGVPITANRNLANWYWDLEDLSPKQLVMFAKEEYGVELPGDAKQETLLKAIFELTKAFIDNQGNLVFMAHTIKMDYDKIIEEIQKSAKDGFSEYETEVIEI